MNEMHGIHLIGAAFGAGSRDPRCAEGPDRVRARLAARGKLRAPLLWRKTVRAPVKTSKKNHVPALATFSRHLARAVHASVVSGSRFVVVGGDHCCAIGTWNGAAAALSRRGPLGLLWIDAHMDAHTPETSTSGNLHGMPLACLLGFGESKLARLSNRQKADLSPAHVCLIGIRSFEPAEAALLEQLGVRVYGMDDVRARGIAEVMQEALTYVQRGTVGFGVTLDLDVVDPRQAPAVTTPAPGGLQGAELVDALRMAVQQTSLVGVEIAEFNPVCDEEGRTAALVETLIDTVTQVQFIADPAVALERRYCANNYEPLPVVLSKGRGVFVWDTAGRRYYDMMSAYSAVSFGHAHPRLLKALTTQARRLSLVSRAYYTDRLGPFVERLCHITGFDRALPMNTGAEAVETALKAARKWAHKIKGVPEGRAEIIACAGNFHGRTIAITGLSSEPSYRDGFGPFPPGLVIVPYCDARALEAAITPNTAAFLVEPIQGEGGIVVPPSGYLSACAEICRRHNVLLLCDEVQTGLGRTGRLFAFEHDGIRPDGVMLGKALSGGLVPVSAFLASAEVMSVFTPGTHGSTFGGNPLACAVALEVLNLLEEDRLAERSTELGAYLMQRLTQLRSPLVQAVRGRGLFVGIELNSTGATARDVSEIMLRHGVLTKDTHETTLRFVPPLIITRTQLDDALERIAHALQKAESNSGLRRQTG